MAYPKVNIDHTSGVIAKVVQGKTWGMARGETLSSFVLVKVNGRRQAEWIGAYDNETVAQGHRKFFTGSKLVVDQQGRLNLIRYLPDVLRHIGRGGNYLVIGSKRKIPKGVTP